MGDEEEKSSNSGIELEGSILGSGGKLKVSENILRGALKPVSDGYGFVADWISDRRELKSFERQQRYKVRAAVVFIKTQEELKRLGIEDAQEPSDKFLEIAAPAITVEEDESLQDMWASLLAKAMDPNNDDDLEGIAMLLKDMPAEATHVLHYFATLSAYHQEWGAEPWAQAPNPNDAQWRDKLADWSKAFEVSEFVNHIIPMGAKGEQGYHHLIRLNIIIDRKLAATSSIGNMSGGHLLSGRDKQHEQSQQAINALSKEYRQFTPLGLVLIDLIRSSENLKLKADQ